MRCGSGGFPRERCALCCSARARVSQECCSGSVAPVVPLRFRQDTTQHPPGTWCISLAVAVAVAAAVEGFF